MKEQRSIKLRPHEVTAKRDSMLFFVLTRTLAVLTGFGFSNPDQAWAQALNDDRRTGALPAAESAPEASPSMPVRVPERIPTSTHEQVREPTPSPVPSSRLPTIDSLT